MYNFLKLLKKARRKKVDVKIILTGSKEKKWQLIKDYLKERINIRYLQLNNFSLMIADSKYCKITTKNRNDNQRNNILINDEDLSKAMNEYFLILWKKARDIKELEAKNKN